MCVTFQEGFPFSGCVCLTCSVISAVWSDNSTWVNIRYISIIALQQCNIDRVASIIKRALSWYSTLQELLKLPQRQTDCRLQHGLQQMLHAIITLHPFKLCLGCGERIEISESARYGWSTNIETGINVRHLLSIEVPALQSRLFQSLSSGYWCCYFSFL